MNAFYKHVERPLVVTKTPANDPCRFPRSADADVGSRRYVRQISPDMLERIHAETRPTLYDQMRANSVAYDRGDAWGGKIGVAIAVFGVIMLVASMGGLLR